ncbi:DNA replication and repair protein RecN [Antricoccus suffuscus]|uniref:DNA repair protein RecN n=1 Tax=Antricoccus suffuscus TaxID=1629062 RepID=A0A2T0ZX79_9ACTN|nr:DNA repair protein RecN [Antricoccus suffuscus]PRZ40943.1 DNA replication and repair protein RecN [Antricoccus suffuscus]
MLEEVRIRNLGVIADATLQLDRGFTVVTGETGAGKTMVVAGLMLMFGERSDSSQVSHDAASADIEGRLRLAPDSHAVRRTTEAGGDVDEDGTLILSRSVSKNGRSRASAGGRSVPVGVLAELADSVIAVHGQSTQLRLAQPAQQRELLDRYAGAPVTQALADYRAAYDEWRRIEQERDDRLRNDDERRRTRQMLMFGLEQVDAAAPRPGEDERLEQELGRLANADSLRQSVQAAHTALVGADDDAGGDSISTLIGRAVRALDEGGVHDESLAELATRAKEISYLATDLASDVSGYAEGVSDDPERLAQAMARRVELRELVRNYGGADGVAGVLAWADDARAQLDAMDDSAESMARLEQQVTQAQASAQTAAAALSSRRREAAGSFQDAIGAQLAKLAMGSVRIGVRVSPREAAAGRPTLEADGRPAGASPDGIDTVHIELSSDGGTTYRPLAKGASGGELSRVMLAIEVVLAGTDPVPTMVFDEVDSGVGGESAIEIGRLLAVLGKDHQVIAVTHLPQVAAYADRHVVIEKSGAQGVTRSDIRHLDHAERIVELTRMLAGLTDSDSGRAHAAELLETAYQERDPSAATRPAAKSSAKKSTTKAAAPAKKSPTKAGRRTTTSKRARQVSDPK